MGFEVCEVVKINSIATLTYIRIGEGESAVYCVKYENPRAKVLHTESGASFSEALTRLYWNCMETPKSHDAFIRKEIKRLS